MKTNKKLRKELEDLQTAYDIAMAEINRLRKLNEKLNKTLKLYSHGEYLDYTPEERASKDFKKGKYNPRGFMKIIKLNTPKRGGYQ